MNSFSGNHTMVLSPILAAFIFSFGGLKNILLIVSFKKGAKKNAQMIYLSAAISFLLGDILMAVGRNAFVWVFAGIAASLPIPFIHAGQNVLLYSRVPEAMQGRVFAVRNAIQDLEALK